MPILRITPRCLRALAERTAAGRVFKSTAVLGLDGLYAVPVDEEVATAIADLERRSPGLSTSDVLLRQLGGLS